MPGNTLPLGNWDPWGLHQISPKIVRRYRESEIKHGRLAMMGVTGFLLQEQYHPQHQEIGGLAITHMQQLSKNIFSLEELSSNIAKIGSTEIDFVLILLISCSFEIFTLSKNWAVQNDHTYHHQFDDTLGIAELRPVKCS